MLLPKKNEKKKKSVPPIGMAGTNKKNYKKKVTSVSACHELTHVRKGAHSCHLKRRE